MPRIAVSGHRGLNPNTTRLVDTAVRAALQTVTGDITGTSLLADGADQIFAQAVLELGGKLEVVVPAERYRAGLPDTAQPAYDQLMAAAVEVHRLSFHDSTEQSHMAASEYMIDRADVLYAVWDGQPARGHGGTADVVTYAREHGLPVRVIWPDGAERD